MSTVLIGLFRNIKEYKGTTVNLLIVGSTMAFENILNTLTFSCPCVDIADLEPCNLHVNITNTPCMPPPGSQRYSLSYLIVPAFILFVIGLSANTKLWKLITGRRRKNERNKRSRLKIPQNSSVLSNTSWDNFCVVIQVTAKCLVSSMAWISYGMLDGSYVACFLTPIPYDLSKEDGVENCQKMLNQGVEGRYSTMFYKNKYYSQFLGWCIIGGIAATAFVVYAVHEYCFPITYYQTKYFRIYRDVENEMFEDFLKNKAKEDSKDYIEEFLSKRRSNRIWDQISSVITYHKDENNLSIYSNLQDWVLEDAQRNTESSSPNGNLHANEMKSFR